jgi:hypothetical protein
LGLGYKVLSVIVNDLNKLTFHWIVIVNEVKQSPEIAASLRSS